MVSNGPRLAVMVCRGCCCGTAKHPQVDHEAQIRTLKHAADASPAVELVVTNCLGPCGQSNVIRVREIDADDRHDLWFGRLCTPDSTAVLAAWLAGGAPLDRPPAALARHQLRPDPRIITPDEVLFFRTGGCTPRGALGEQYHTDERVAEDGAAHTGSWAVRRVRG